MNYYGTLYLKLLYGAMSYNPSKIRGGTDVRYKIRGGTRCPLQNPWWNTMSGEMNEANGEQHSI